jgi:hypothetical protein
MMSDAITRLLEEVVSGKVSIKDARAALEDAELTETQYHAAVDHGVFNPAEPGTIVNASLAPSGGSLLLIFFFGWGLFWVLYWTSSMLYGLFMHWDQQQLSYHFAMTLTTIILMGVVYMKWVLPDKVIVKYRRPKYVREHPKDWVEYKL